MTKIAVVQMRSGEAGMISVRGIPREAATKARAIPILPLVGSTSSIPGQEYPTAHRLMTVWN